MPGENHAKRFERLGPPPREPVGLPPSLRTPSPIDGEADGVDTWLSPLTPEVRRRAGSALRRRVTITDVARQCGVTPATVSRVLNNKKKFSTSEVVRAKILETARKMGYTPDLAARNLNRGTTRIIGLFASPLTHVAEGINEPLLEGMADVLHSGGYDVFFELGAVTRPQGGALPFWRFDGGIIMQAPKPDTIRELDHRRVPYVCVNETVGNPAASVLADDPMGMRRAVEHLMTLGHRRLAYANARATYFTHYSVTERYETLLSEAQHRGLALAAGHDTPFADGGDFLRASITGAGATAVITYDHQIAVTLVGAAHALGLRIPQDFSLICFNDVFPVSVLGPPLTAVAVSGREMGRVGADLLLNVLQGASKPPPRQIRIAEDLIVRGSTAPPPATTPVGRR
jgi:LacI family transcriptional regulator